VGIERQNLRLGPVDWPAPTFARFPTIDHERRRKLTFVSSGYTGNMTGGIARFISDLAPALARRGHEVRVITRAATHAAVDFEEAVWVHRIETPRVGADGALPNALDHINDFATASVHELERIASWTTHDVVYGPLWDVEILGAVRRTSFPTVVQVATPLAVAAEMAGFMDDPASRVALARLVELEEDVLAEADLFHANSTSVVDTIERLYRARAHTDRWQVVALGSLDRWRPTHAPRTDRVRVLYVGRFEVRKGIDTVLAVMPSILRDHRDVEFVAAGEDRPLAPGEPLCGAEWLDRHRSEPWIDRVRFEGVVSDERLHELYEEADVVVLPSRYESFGLVMVEGMMHGRAVVSCDTSGVREVVRHDVDGLLVPPGDAGALDVAIRRLLVDADLRAEIGRTARQRFLDVFHIDRFAERFEKFLERIRFCDTLMAEAGTDGDSGYEGRRGATGRPAAVLRSGGRIRLPVDDRTAARLCVDARQPSTIVVRAGNTSTTYLVDPGDTRRIDIDTSISPIDVSVVHGEVVVNGIVAVDKAGAR
jgi:glycosyltransferase involved in cell wall biosynthesis